MKPAALRKFMLKNRVFLHMLFSEPKKVTAQRLSLCTNIQANVLLHILHEIVKGNIPLRKADYATLRKTKRLTHIESIESKPKFREILKASREKKVQFLRKIVALYPLLLKLLFEDE